MANNVLVGRTTAEKLDYDSDITLNYKMSDHRAILIEMDL